MVGDLAPQPYYHQNRCNWYTSHDNGQPSRRQLIALVLIFSMSSSCPPHGAYPIAIGTEGRNGQAFHMSDRSDRSLLMIYTIYVIQGTHIPGSHDLHGLQIKLPSGSLTICMVYSTYDMSWVTSVLHRSHTAYHNDRYRI